MTLKGKNRYTFVFSIFFLGMSIFFLLYFLFRMNAMPNNATFSGHSLSIEAYSPFRQNIWTLFFTGFFLLVYVPAIAFYTYSHFIKTPSTEIIYFMLFLFGCMIEIIRMLVPLETAQNAYPEFLVLLGRLLFWGRILCFSALFTSVVAGEPDQRINAEQNIFILIIFSLTLAYFVPVNTTEITDGFSIDVGMKKTMILFCIIVTLLTFASYAIKSWQNESKNHLLLGFDIILIEAGFILLTVGAVLIPAILGAVFLTIGTFFYLNHLHKLYV